MISATLGMPCNLYLRAACDLSLVKLSEAPLSYAFISSVTT